MSVPLGNDLRFGLRTLAARPGFTQLVVLTLAMAIGSNAAMFGVVDATLLTPLPYASPERLVRVWETTPQDQSFSASEPNFLDFRERNRSFERLAATKDVSLTLLTGGEPVRLEGLAVSHGFFATLGIAPALGRAFSVDEDAPGGNAAVVVLSHALWTQRFGGDRELLGRTVQLEGRPHTVIGVMPSGFDFLGATLWVPLAADPASDRGDHWLQMIGRLRAGVTPEQAERDLDGIAARIGGTHPVVAGWGVRITSFNDWLVGASYRQTALLLFGAVALLMLIACANVANVLLAHATRRQAELGLRTALGASRAALVRQLLVEVGLVVATAVALGIALAHGLVAALQRFGTDAIPRLDSVAVDGRVLGFSVALGLLTGLVFGVGPVLRASRVAPVQALAGGARAGVSRRHRRISEALVVMQVGVALALTFAEQMWPGEDAVGKAFYWGGTNGTPRTVVGVVGDFQDVEAGAPMPPVLFLPYGELPWASMTLLLRMQPGQAVPHAAIRDAVHALAPTLAVPRIEPLASQLAQSVAAPRLRTLLLGSFATIALLLAAVGVYGVMAASAAQRQRELGLRLALGARPVALVRMLLANGLRLGLAGAALGLVGAWFAGRLLQGLLYGSVALDLPAVLGSTALLALVVLIASGVPALRAARVDPAKTLQDCR